MDSTPGWLAPVKCKHMQRMCLISTISSHQFRPIKSEKCHSLLTTAKTQYSYSHLRTVGVVQTNRTSEPYSIPILPAPVCNYLGDPPFLRATPKHAGSYKTARAYAQAVNKMADVPGRFSKKREIALSQ